MNTNKHESVDMKKLLEGVTVEWKALGEVAIFNRGTAITKKQCLEKEFALGSIPFVAQQELQLTYKGQPLRQTYQPDFTCYGKIIVELKAVKHHHLPRSGTGDHCCDHLVW